MKKIPISKSFYRGKNITNPMEIKRLALERKSVYHTCWGLKPAAVILGMQFKSVVDSIEQKRFFYTIK